MDSSAYDKAAVPEPFRVLGETLCGYTLGHHLLLNLIQSPFISGGIPSYDDLALAVVICSRPYKEAKAFIHSPVLAHALRYFQWVVSGRLNPLCWLRLKKPRVIDLARESQEFVRYLADGKHIPEYIPCKGTSAFECPFHHAVWATIQNKTGLSDDEVLNRGWWLNVQQYYVFKHFDGVLSIVDHHGIEDAQAVADKAAQLLKEGRFGGLKVV